MGRILAIDYGTKRVGVAVTDPLKIVAGALETVPNSLILKFLDNYLASNEVETIVVGLPRQMSGELSEPAVHIVPFAERLRVRYPAVNVVFTDERFTSKMAFQTMIDGGVKKMDRRDKGMIDRISATIILQSYMEMNN